MIKWVLMLAFFLGPTTQAWASSGFPKCLIDKLEGVSNLAAHQAGWQLCRAQYPDEFYGAIQGSGRGIFGYKSGHACTLAKASKTTFQLSAAAIARACRCLYDPPNPFSNPGFSGAQKGPVMCDYIDWNRGIITQPAGS